LEDVTLLFVGDDWAEDHHDVEIQDETGRRLAKARLPEGISGIARLHQLVGRFLPEDGDGAGVKIGIETDRGPWVAALVASGYQVYAINPLQSARARQGHDVSGAKSDAGDAHVLADLVRTQSHQLRTVAGDSENAGATKVLTRMHQSLIWDRTRQVLRLRSALREFFPAALEARGGQRAGTPPGPWPDRRGRRQRVEHGPEPGNGLFGVLEVLRCRGEGRWRARHGGRGGCRGCRGPGEHVEEPHGLGGRPVGLLTASGSGPGPGLRGTVVHADVAAMTAPRNAATIKRLVSDICVTPLSHNAEGCRRCPGGQAEQS